MGANPAPDGHTHYYRNTCAGARVLIWTGDGEPHPDAFAYAVSVLTLAGMGTARLPKLTTRISSALAGWCADRLLPVARIDRTLLFPITAVQTWLDAEGRAKIAAWSAGEKVVPFARR